MVDPSPPGRCLGHDGRLTQIFSAGGIEPDKLKIPEKMMDREQIIAKRMQKLTEQSQ